MKKIATVSDPAGIRTVFRVPGRSVEVFEASLACVRRSLAGSGATERRACGEAT